MEAPGEYEAGWTGSDQGLACCWLRAIEKAKVIGPCSTCKQADERRGGLITSSVTKKLHNLVVEGPGSSEWKPWSFGTKIEKAVQYRTSGVPLMIVHEDIRAGSLRE